MQPVAVVTDSTSDLPAALAQDNGVRVVPLTVNFAEESFVDGDLTQEEFFKRMKASPKLPTTSQPPVGAFVEAYERALERADAVVSVHISSKLSGTMESARQAAERFGDRVHLFDSLNLSGALGLQALEAARAAAGGAGVKGVIEAASAARDRVRMLVGLDSLDNLAKGGRIGQVSKFFGSVLDLKVTFTVTDGEFVPVKRSRGEKAALRHTLEWVAEQMRGRSRAAFMVLHAMADERAQSVAESLRSAYDVSELHIVPVGAVISTHTGSGWGVALLPEK